MAVVIKKVQGNHVEAYYDSVEDLEDIDKVVPSDVTVEAGSLAYDADGNIAIYDGKDWKVKQ